MSSHQVVELQLESLCSVNLRVFVDGLPAIEDDYSFMTQIFFITHHCLQLGKNKRLFVYHSCNTMFRAKPSV